MPGLVRLCWWWSGSGGFAAAAVGAFDDANQNCGCNDQDAVDRVEFAAHSSSIHRERCDAERPNAKPKTSDFMWVIWV
jgi:hypothetical protein